MQRRRANSTSMGPALFAAVFAAICFIGLVAVVILLSQGSLLPEVQTREVEVRETTTDPELQALWATTIWFLALLGISLFFLAIWIAAFINCVTRYPSDNNDKLVWVLVLIFLGAFGAVVYICVAWKGPVRRRYPTRRH